MKQLIESILTENAKKREFSCVMTDSPSTDINTDVLRYSLSIPDEDLYNDEPGYGREFDVHATVKYGIETEEPTEVEAKVVGVVPFDITLGKISLFSRDDKPYDVVKIDLTSEGLVSLNKLLSTLLNGDENPKYVPHMTLAYVKKGKGKDYVGVDVFDGKTFTVDTLIFSDHSGNKTRINLGEN